jgi:hypothetical protein
MMKALWLSMAMAMMVVRGQAQLFGPESLGGALLGGLADGFISHNICHRTGEGVAIGAPLSIIRSYPDAGSPNPAMASANALFGR